MDEIKIQVNFKADTKYGSYADSLYFTQSEWVTNPDVETLKKARIDNWVSYMDSVSKPVPLTKDQLIVKSNALVEMIADLNSQKSELDQKISGM